MTETLKFILRVFVQQGIWIAGLGWLLAVGGWAVFIRRNGGERSAEDSPNLLKRKALIGAIVLAIGIVIAL